MSAYREIELKLRTDADALTKVRRSGWWRKLEPAQRQSHHSIYFDTGDRQLRDCNISLHTHTNGRAITQTVTMRNGHADPASGREWEMLVPDPVPDPTLVIDPALPRDFRKLTPSTCSRYSTSRSAARRVT